MANAKLRIRSGDTVKVIAGKDKGEALNESPPIDVKSLLP